MGMRRGLYFIDRSEYDSSFVEDNNPVRNLPHRLESWVTTTK
jgi:hypothetical protein